MRRTISGALRMMLMLNVPATIGLMVLARPIVALLLQRHAFGPADTAATAAALVFYAPGLIGYSAIKIASPAFYSLRDARTPVLISVASVVGNLVVNLALIRVLGFRGLALGTSLAALFNAAALLWLLDRRIGGLERRDILIALAKIAGAAAIMGLAAAGASIWLESLMPDGHTIGRAVRVFLSIGAGLVALVLAARALRIAELADALKRVGGRLLTR
jgi:putative peptidoglycan lipid II flippase